MSDSPFSSTQRSIWLADPDARNPFFVVSRFTPDRKYVPFLDEFRIFEVPVTWDIKRGSGVNLSDSVLLGESFLLPNQSLPSWLRHLNFTDIVTPNESLPVVQTTRRFSNEQNYNLVLSENFSILTTKSSSNQFVFVESVALSEIPLFNDLRVVNKQARILSFVDGINLIEGNN